MSTDKPLKISIAMATYNGGNYLEEQLDSFLAQTRLPDELVITDDCSTDNTLEIIQAFAAKAPFEVRWEQNEKNLGYTHNFNQALMKTTGDLVFLSDQDDVWFPEKLARMERYALDEPNALVVMNDAALTDSALNDTGFTKQGQIASAGMTSSNFVMGCCAVVRRELLDICLPIPTHYKGHDSWIVKMAEGMRRKYVVPDVLQWYRRHNANESEFIANRTTRVTRGMAFRQNLKNAFGATSHHEKLRKTCAQTQCFFEGLASAKQQASGPLLKVLAEFALKTEEQLNALTYRKYFVTKSRIMRTPHILRLYLSGGYRHFYGIKSAMQDLICK